MKIRLNEEQLKKVVAEGVKRVLKEISAKTAYAAADKAKERGQNVRALRFRDYAVQAWQRNAPEDVIAVSRNNITYINSQGREVTITSTRMYGFVNNPDTISVEKIAAEGVPSKFRVSNVRVARYLAEWWNENGFYSQKPADKGWFIA